MSDQPSTPEPLEFLSRDQILSVVDYSTRVVDVPEWKGKVMVKTITAGAKAWIESTMIRDAQSGKGLQVEVDDESGGKTQLNLDRFYLKLVVAAVVDPNTLKPIFTEADLIPLAEKSSGAVNRIAEVVVEMNRITKEEIDQVKNEYGEILGTDSDSDSQGTSDSPSPTSTE